MHVCKWCQLAQELSGIPSQKCRPCYRRKRKMEMLKKERLQKKAK